MTQDRANFERQYAELRLAGRDGWLPPHRQAEVLGYIRRLLAAAGVSGGRVLELGCGAGNMSVQLAAMGFRVVGLDVAPTAIEWAKSRAAEHGSQIKFLEMSATDLEQLKGEQFDVVLDSLCLHSLIGMNRQKCCAGVLRAMCPGGCFLVMTMCNDPLPLRLRSVFDPSSRCIRSGDAVDVCLLPAEEILRDLTIAGFSVTFSEIIPGNAKTEDQDLLLAVCRHSHSVMP